MLDRGSCPGTLGQAMSPATERRARSCTRALRRAQRMLKAAPASMQLGMQLGVARRRLPVQAALLWQHPIPDPHSRRMRRSQVAGATTWRRGLRLTLQAALLRPWAARAQEARRLCAPCGILLVLQPSTSCPATLPWFTVGRWHKVCALFWRHLPGCEPGMGRKSCALLTRTRQITACIACMHAIVHGVTGSAAVVSTDQPCLCLNSPS